MATKKTKLPKYAYAVVNPFDSYDSENRKGVMVGGPWVSEISKFIRENEIKAVYLNTAYGWSDSDYSFLSELDSVEELHILTGRASTGLSAIENMTSLVDLGITVTTKDKVDFAKLLKLKKCFLCWWSGAESILDCSQLENLYIDRFKVKDFTQLGKLSKLKTLTIGNSQIDTTSCLKGLNQLVELNFYNCRKLSDFDAVKYCPTIRRLDLSGSKLLSDIKFIVMVPHLEILILSDCGAIDSLKPLVQLKNLRTFWFAGNTVITDGDLSVLEVLPKLSILRFNGKRHYTHKLIKSSSGDISTSGKLLEKR